MVAPDQTEGKEKRDSSVVSKGTLDDMIGEQSMMKKNSEGVSREAGIGGAGAKMKLGLTESLTPKGISHY